MTNIHQIAAAIEQRLDVLLDEADRLRAAIHALGSGADTSAPSGRGTRAGARARAVNDGVGTTAPEPKGPVADAPTPAAATAGRPRDARAIARRPAAAMPSTPRDRALLDLRRELAAGLRNI